MTGGQGHRHHHHHLHLPSIHLPHLGLGHGHEERPPKGYMAVRVGREGEEQRKFVVPVEYVNHPLFARLLKEAENEYGFHQEGAVTLPCSVEDFQSVHDAIDRETRAAAHHHHHHHHHSTAVSSSQDV